jgi:hypothetical protein
MTLLLPAINHVKRSAQKVQDVANLKKISEAWRECVVNRGWVIDGMGSAGENPNDQDGGRRLSTFAAQLAGFDQKSIKDIILNDPYVYISTGDKYASKVLTTAICNFDGTKNTALTWADKASNFMTTGSGVTFFISYCLVFSLPSIAPLSTTPLGFTRGLRVDGKWDEKGGLYGSKGGYVVYADGHVVWFDGDRPARFLKWNGQAYTSDIREAIPSAAFITCGNGFINTSYPTGPNDGKHVILSEFGKGGN